MLRVPAVLALLIQLSAAPAQSLLALDDGACVFSTTTRACEPAASCSFQFRFGDLSFDQACRADVAVVGATPQQVHLAFAGESAGTGMTVSWATFSRLEEPKVWLGAAADAELTEVGADQVAIQVESYVDGQDTGLSYNYSLFSYHATLSGLVPHTEYAYQVGSETARSNASSFVTARAANATESEDETFEVLIYGDFGADANAAHTLEYLGNLSRPIDFVFHIGDVAYADNAWLSLSTILGDFYEELYNRWMNSLSFLLPSVPYMVLAGNHESECHSPSCFFLPAAAQRRWSNYSALNSRFKMPSAESGGASNMWYSFDHGPVHFVAISSETDFPDAPRNSFLEEEPTGARYGGFGDQLAWLEQDLKQAAANRDATPWIIVGMHRAMYTVTSSDESGNPTGIPATLQAAFEELFIAHSVDVVVAGHVHSYERQYPIARGKKVADGVSADGKLYASPQAPVYLLTGAAGNNEGLTSYANASAESWNVVADDEHYAISSLKANRSALAFQLIGTEASALGTVLDEFTITKQA